MLQKLCRYGKLICFSAATTSAGNNGSASGWKRKSAFGTYDKNTKMSRKRKKRSHRKRRGRKLKGAEKYSMAGRGLQEASEHAGINKRGKSRHLFRWTRRQRGSSVFARVWRTFGDRITAGKDVSGHVLKAKKTVSVALAGGELVDFASEENL